jgi:cleavage and polyadenylation specificity factor subunit 2
VDILIDGFVPPASSVAPMFPFCENTAHWDDFGEVINPDDYMMKQDGVDNNLMLVSSLMHLLFLLTAQYVF